MDFGSPTQQSQNRPAPRPPVTAPSAPSPQPPVENNVNDRNDTNEMEDPEPGGAFDDMYEYAYELPRLDEPRQGDLLAGLEEEPGGGEADEPQLRRSQRQRRPSRYHRDLQDGLGITGTRARQEP